MTIDRLSEHYTQLPHRGKSPIRTWRKAHTVIQGPVPPENRHGGLLTSGYPEGGIRTRPRPSCEKRYSQANRGAARLTLDLIRTGSGSDLHDRGAPDPADERTRQLRGDAIAGLQVEPGGREMLASPRRVQAGGQRAGRNALRRWRRTERERRRQEPSWRRIPTRALRRTRARFGVRRVGVGSLVCLGVDRARVLAFFL